MTSPTAQGIAWQHPTSILLLDDDEIFVRSLGAALAPSAVAPFTEPGAALRHLHVLASRFGETAEPRRWEFDDELTLEARTAWRAALPRTLIASADRFALIQVAVVDQVMPSLSGTEFCRQARELGVKTILLSGRMNDAEALAAFNHGDIDRYVAKNDPDALAKIAQMSEDLRQQRLREHTGSLTPFLDARGRDLVARHDLWDVLGQAARIFPFCEHFFDPVAPGFLLVSGTGDHRFLLVGDAAEQRRTASLVEDLEGCTPEYDGLKAGLMMAWNLLDATAPNDLGETDLTRFIFQANRHGSLVWSLLSPDLIPVDYQRPEGSWNAFSSTRRVRDLDA
jgi:CheY-like chemotaxis protein